MSDHAQHYILKGALMLRAWKSPEFRPTMDIDMLGKTGNEEENITAQIRDILAVEIEPDGLSFDSSSIQTERITEDADYEGIQNLFPAEFEHTEEMGWIPQGWTVGPIYKLCEKVQNGGTPNRSKSEYWDGGTIPWLTSGEVRQTIIVKTENFISETGLKNSSAKWLPFGATVVALYGATAGQVALVASEMTTNQAVCGLIPKENYTFFNYLALERGVSSLANQARGSAQQNISKGIVEDTKVVIPSGVITEKFETECHPIFSKWIHNLNADIALSSTRDTLLPQLLSGEMRISEAEKLVEEIGIMRDEL